MVMSNSASTGSGAGGGAAVSLMSRFPRVWRDPGCGARHAGRAAECSLELQDVEHHQDRHDHRDDRFPAPYAHGVYAHLATVMTVHIGALLRLRRNRRKAAR